MTPVSAMWFLVSLVLVTLLLVLLLQFVVR
jgi:hypothetical protein